MIGPCPVHQHFDPLGLDYLADSHRPWRPSRAETAAFYAPQLGRRCTYSALLPTLLSISGSRAAAAGPANDRRAMDLSRRHLR